MSFIKPMQGSPESSLTPLFLIHAVSGLANPYSRLGPLTKPSFAISQDEERMVYGISSPLYTHHGSFKAPRTLEAMARLYVNAIRKKQPYGPYLLGGWSMGGMLAVKMAAILMGEHGEQVLKVVVIDGANPEKLPPMSGEEQNVIGDEIFARNLAFAGGNSGKTRARSLAVPGSGDSATSSDSEASTHASSPLETLLLKIRSHIALGLELMSCVEEGSWVQVGDPLKTKMTLVKCVDEAYLEDGQFGDKGVGVRTLMAEECMGWNADCFDSLEVIKLIGPTHDTCFEEKFVGKLTDILAECLIGVH